MSPDEIEAAQIVFNKILQIFQPLHYKLQNVSVSYYTQNCLFKVNLSGFGRDKIFTYMDRLFLQFELHYLNLSSLLPKIDLRCAWTCKLRSREKFLFHTMFRVLFGPLEIINFINKDTNHNPSNHYSIKKLQFLS